MPALSITAPPPAVESYRLRLPDGVIAEVAFRGNQVTPLTLPSRPPAPVAAEVEELA